MTQHDMSHMQRSSSRSLGGCTARNARPPSLVRRGLVLKRWKSYYCPLRDNDRLCLYASEDTVNGRVLLADKSDAFHVIPESLN